MFNHQKFYGRVVMVEPALVKAENVNTNLSTLIGSNNKSYFDHFILDEKQNVSLGWTLSQPLFQIMGYIINLKILTIFLLISIISIIIDWKISILFSLPLLFSVIIIGLLNF